jgi:hypothetical protein
VKHLPPARTTHTLEMRQIEDVNDALPKRSVTASEIGLEHATLLTGLHPGGTLPPSAVLQRLDADGDPEFPYLHADFGHSPSDGTRWRVDVHTAALHRLAHLLNLHQVWGIGSPSTTSEP